MFSNMQVASNDEIRIQLDLESRSLIRPLRPQQTISCITFKSVIFGTLLMWTISLFYILATIS